MREDHCENCKFFDAEKGECHKNAPRRRSDEYEMMGQGSNWPSVGPKDWCAQFKPVRNTLSEILQPTMEKLG